MKPLVFLLLALSACTHTYNDRELGSPPKHPFKFRAPPPSAPAESNDTDKVPGADPNTRPSRDASPDLGAPPPTR